MRITKPFDIEMIVTENIPPEDMEILCQCFSAEIVEYNLQNHISRPHYVKYRVVELEPEVKPIT